ncbi:MAG: flagellar hook-length control protein FliK [Gammaproteobacteria bacterium]|nr:flagellar hook-length control protein FliK [Gammaproteobacteria bacterium]MDH3537821.1 flagellar hook-length control protein FliK [Gammaproteobacteria bacterium]
MNIMLTDLRALTLDTQEGPALAARPAGGFAGLLRQQLPSAFDSGQQVVEFNGYFPEIPGVEMSLGTGVEATPEAGWREYLAQQQIGVSVDAGTLASAPAESAEMPLNPTLKADAEAFIASDAAGEFLPAGGNSLPDEATPRPLIRAANVDTAGLDPGLMPTKTLVTASSEPAQQAIAAEIAAFGANLGGVNPTRAGQLAEPGEQIPQPSPIASVPGRVAADGRAGAESVAAVKSWTRPVPPAVASGATLMHAPRMPPLDADAASPDAPKPLERRIPSSILPVEAGSAQQPATPRDVDGAAENLRISDLRDAFKLTPALQKPVPEIPITDPTSGRAVDLPVQAAANNAQQAVTAAQPLLHSLATPGASAPGAQQAVLPGPLDAMNLSRNADASDWGNGLGERVNWMINQKQNSATIRLDPPTLGKLDVHVRVADDATTITIQTQHAQTRDLIETAALRLRDYLQESGYQNVNVDVSQRQDQQHTQSQAQHGYTEGGDEFDPDQNLDPGRSLHSGFMSGDGLVDTFA